MDVDVKLLRQLTEAYDLAGFDEEDGGQAADNLASYVSANLNAILEACRNG